MAWEVSCLLLGPQITVTKERPDVLHVDGLTAEQVGSIAWQGHLPVYELAVEHTSLEAAFMAQTSDSFEYRSTDTSEAAA